MSEVTNLLKRDQNRSDQSLPSWVSPRHRFMGSLNIARSLPGADPTCQHRSPNWKHPQNPNLQQNEAPQWFDCCNKKKREKKGGWFSRGKELETFFDIARYNKKGCSSYNVAYTYSPWGWAFLFAKCFQLQKDLRNMTFLRESPHLLTIAMVVLVVIWLF